MGPHRRPPRAGCLRLTVATLAAAALFAAACATGTSISEPTVEVQVAPSPTAAATRAGPAGDPGVTVANAVQACREKDAQRLLAFVSGDVSLPEVEAMLARGTDVLLRAQSVPEIAGGQATVQVRLEVRRTGETEFVDRSWDLVHDPDGVWRFTELPECY